MLNENEEGFEGVKEAIVQRQKTKDLEELEHVLEDELNKTISMTEAKLRGDFKEVLQGEIQNLEQSGNCRMIDESEIEMDMKRVKCRIVASLKKLAKGDKIRLKLRLVVKGFQIAGEKRISSPTTRKFTPQVLIAIGQAREDMRIDILDIKRAFLQLRIEDTLVKNRRQQKIVVESSYFPKGKVLEISGAIYGEFNTPYYFYQSLITVG